jgi:hypothetical protein
MKRIIATGAVAALATLGFAGTAAASGPPQGAGQGGKPAGIVCQQFGLGILVATGNVKTVATGQLGVPLNEVLALHRTDTAGANALLKTVGPDLLPPGTDLGPVVKAIDAACPA